MHLTTVTRTLSIRSAHQCYTDRQGLALLPGRPSTDIGINARKTVLAADGKAFSHRQVYALTVTKAPGHRQVNVDMTIRLGKSA